MSETTGKDADLEKFFTRFFLGAVKSLRSFLFEQKLSTDHSFVPRAAAFAYLVVDLRLASVEHEMVSTQGKQINLRDAAACGMKSLVASYYPPIDESTVLTHVDRYFEAFRRGENSGDRMYLLCSLFCQEFGSKDPLVTIRFATAVASLISVLNRRLGS